ncbi:pentatricopeptide repeat-containing protein At5g04810, chloroplastic-like [Triticum urartu]|uniref:pentatricopeptide repeat-containing protein At5g04810, chloroplastic-like n=1 Tax=Triticum urartu TaxID=4572 RepID=UPI0020431DCE|nr:pentatricopeptide repeat-containing protein At5g04810, chloroplastic-like [Triticum urartu]
MAELDKVELVRTHDDPELNAGFCFLYIHGHRARDGARGEGRRGVLPGHVAHGAARRREEGVEDRARWVDHGQGKEAPSPWHHGRDEACCEFRRVVESRPEDWQAIVSAFERIPKVGGFSLGQDLRPSASTLLGRRRHGRQGCCARYSHVF